MPHKCNKPLQNIWENVESVDYIAIAERVEEQIRQGSSNDSLAVMLEIYIRDKEGLVQTYTRIGNGRRWEGKNPLGH